MNERNGCDVGYAVGDCVASSFAFRTFHEQAPVFVKQDPIHTDVGGVKWIHRYRPQARAVIERTSPEVGDAVPDCDAGQIYAFIKCQVSDARDAVGDCDAGEADLELESFKRDSGDRDAIDRVRNRHVAAGPTY